MEKAGIVVRAMVVIGSLLLAATFFLPLWEIQLWAPQYPEGLAMQIWSHKFSGDITTINILNHYIGMAPIEEAGFAELKYFPIAFGILLGLGLIAALIGRCFAVATWSTLLLGFASYCLYDFWQWEYAFGHNLNPDAAIKMEDMTYQPPLIGTADFLNIQASSWPASAGMAFTLSCLLALIATAICFWPKKQRHSTSTAAAAAAVVALLGFLILIPKAQAGSPEAIAFGEDACVSCKMTITDKRFGGELVTPKGKIYKFDSLECLRSYQKTHKEQSFDVFVVDATQDGGLIAAAAAKFILKEKLRSPMGRGVLAGPSEEALNKAFGQAEILQWSDLESVVFSEHQHSH